MKIRLPCWIFILCIMGAISCSNNPKPLNQEYLESGQYTQFKKGLTEELKKNVELDESFEWSLQQFTGCETKHFSFPFELDLQKINTIQKSLSEKCTIQRKSQSLTLLGYHKLSNLLIRLILLDRETVYRDQEIIAVTFIDGELRSFRTVGVFQKNLSKQVTSKILLQNESNEILITTRTNRNILYPIEQNNTVLTEYKIDLKGGIRNF